MRQPGGHDFGLDGRSDHGTAVTGTAPSNHKGAARSAGRPTTHATFYERQATDGALDRLGGRRTLKSGTPESTRRNPGRGWVMTAFLMLWRQLDWRAWDAFPDRPPRDGGWIEAGMGWTCCVYQGQYGHLAGKPAWLYANRVSREDASRWGRQSSPRALELHGYPEGPPHRDDGLWTAEGQTRTHAGWNSGTFSPDSPPHPREGFFGPAMRT